jgi:hypothetical protein
VKIFLQGHIWSTAGGALVGIELTLSYEIPKSTHARWHTKGGGGWGESNEEPWENPSALHYAYCCKFLHSFIIANLSIKEGCLFGMFVALKSPKLQHLVMLLVMLDSPRSAGVHRGGFIMFRSTIHELLNIEHFLKSEILIK